MSFINLALMLLLLLTVASSSKSKNIIFIYNNGFQSSNLTIDGVSTFTSNGLLQLTNHTKQQKGHAFCPNPILLNNSSFFSAILVFAIRSEYQTLNGHGIAFLISPTKALPNALPIQYLGLFNKTNNGSHTNHVVAVELDTIQNSKFKDINDNHVGIDVNDLKSVKSAPAEYYINGGFQNLSLISRVPLQVWWSTVEKRGKILAN